MSGSGKTDYLVVGALFAACVFVTLSTSNGYYLLIISLVFIWATLGLGWNILGGYAGIISFGHAAFFGGGSYAVAILFYKYNVTPWIGLPLGGVVGAVAGLIVGAVTFRLKGYYFSLATLAYPLALLFVFEWLGWTEVTLPLRRDAPIFYMEFPDPRILPLIAFALFAAVLILCLRIERSRFGLILFAIRQNELAAQTAGISTFRWKLLAITLSGAIAGLAGGLYVVAILIVTPNSAFGMLVSAQALIVSMFGGLGTAWGPVIGAIVLVPVAELLNATIADRFPGIQGVVFGAAIIAVILLQPQGVYWGIRNMLLRRRAEKQKAHITVAVGGQPHAPVRSAPIESDVRLGGPLLEVESLSVAFGGVWAVSNVTFTIMQGEILGIIGPNGAGKTTLFNALNGLVRPASGAARFGGRNIFKLPPHEVNAAGIGRTFQTVRAFPHLSLLENVLVGAFRPFGRDDQAIDAAKAALDVVGLFDRAGLPASLLVSHELRRMELARALAGQPKLIFMDESFAGLSASDIEIIVDVIRRVRATGITIAIIEHTMSAMVRLADRLIVLDHGMVIAEGPPAEVVRNSQVVEAYLGKKWAAHA